MSAARARLATSARSTLRTICISLGFVNTTAYPRARSESLSFCATCHAMCTSVVPFCTSVPALVSDGCPGSIAITVAVVERCAAPHAVASSSAAWEILVTRHDEQRRAIEVVNRAQAIRVVVLRHVHDLLLRRHARDRHAVVESL